MGASVAEEAAHRRRLLLITQSASAPLFACVSSFSLVAQRVTPWAAPGLAQCAPGRPPAPPALRHVASSAPLLPSLSLCLPLSLSLSLHPPLLSRRTPSLSRPPPPPAAMDEEARERAWQWMHKQKASSVVELRAGRWDLRFFHMDAATLRYFQAEMSTKPRGEIELASMTEASAVRLEAARLPHGVDPACSNMAIRLKWKNARRAGLGLGAKNDLFLLCGVSRWAWGKGGERAGKERGPRGVAHSERGSGRARRGKGESPATL